jgi:hypothetical protein
VPAASRGVALSASALGSPDGTSPDDAVAAGLAVDTVPPAVVAFMPAVVAVWMLEFVASELPLTVALGAGASQAPAATAPHNARQRNKRKQRTDAAGSGALLLD